MMSSDDLTDMVGFITLMLHDNGWINDRVIIYKHKSTYVNT